MLMLPKRDALCLLHGAVPCYVRSEGRAAFSSHVDCKCEQNRACSCPKFCELCTENIFESSTMPETNLKTGR